MKLLLDTHVFLLWRENNPRLSRAALEAIANGDVVFVSAASAWEIAIKQSLGKIRLDAPFGLGVALQQAGYFFRSRRSGFAS